jgi:hypothetical protein
LAIPPGRGDSLWVLVAPVLRAIVEARLGGALQCVFFPVPFGPNHRGGVP